MIEGVLLLTTGLFVLVTLLPLWRHRAWWVRVWEFPRLQLGALLVALLVAQGMLLDYSQPWHYLISALAGACLVYQLAWVVPYTRPWCNEVRRAETDAAGPRIRVMSSNVLGPNRQSDRLLALVREYRPDVLVTLESDQWWETQLEQLAEQYRTASAAHRTTSTACMCFHVCRWKSRSCAFWWRTTCPPCMPGCVSATSSRCACTFCIRHRPARPRTRNPPSATRSCWWSPGASRTTMTRSSSAVTSMMSPGRPPRACSARSAGCSIRVWAAACTTPSMPITGLCAGRWITSFTARISASSACCGCLISAPTISRCSSSCSTTPSTLKNNMASKPTARTNSRPRKPSTRSRSPRARCRSLRPARDAEPLAISRGDRPMLENTARPVQTREPA
ncbi:hypothetical protein A458_11185 [Stutzerimonas stutzeri CCUG 29243]|uniref:Endonuclease/exonuclease/phosphatase domain-containing protein n=1 Tax=Stutzerimonas stutzeri CCUG 29243 TaxID=1196835 RepID=I4CTR7_STUST|nr:hypothetical protein A458_11185 [Stutzerimonas stutzeri CCUG 29243]